MFRRVSILSAALALLLATGCSEAPETQMQAAEGSLAAAQTAEAEDYASQTIQMAKDTLEAARVAKAEQDSKFSALRSYGHSKELFEAAQRLADQATVEARENKEQVQQEVAAAVVQVQVLVDSCATSLASAPRGKGSKADIEVLKAELESIKSGVVSAQADFDSGKFLLAQSKLATITDRSHTFLQQLEAARAKSGAGL